MARFKLIVNGPSDIERRVINRVYEVVDLGNKVFDCDMDYPVVEFKVRGTTAGTATGDHTVDFNLALLKENEQHFMEDTIPHEVAHCFDKHLFGYQYKTTRTGRKIRESHGRTWKKIMRGLGVDPTRCHSLDTTNVARPKTKYAYTCSCCGSEIAVGPKIHARIQRGYNGYSHKTCKGSKLVYKQSLGKVTYREAAQMKGKPVEPKLPKAPAEPRKGTQISIAVEILEMAYKKGITGRQDVIKMIQIEMNVDLKKASGLHDRAKKKVGV